VAAVSSVGHRPPRRADRQPDLLVVGGGAAGLSAARAGARRGASVVLVEQGRLGGDCTFTGCIPSKTLIAAAARHEPFLDAMARVRTAIEVIAATEDDAALGRDGVTVVHGTARFTRPRVLDVGGEEWRPRRVVLATGAHPVVPPIAGLEHVRVLTNETLFDVDEQPAVLGVLGGGAIGCELAQAFRRLGTHVVLIEREGRLLPDEEPDASAVIEAVLRREGVDVRVDAQLTTVVAARGRGRLVFDRGPASEVDALLVAVGRAPSLDGLGLDVAGIAVVGGIVATDDHLSTSADGVWAAGDVTGRANLTHAADEMGRIAAANALARWGRRRFDDATIPRVVFTDPEVASIGPTRARLAGSPIRVAHLPMTAVDRAVTTGQTDGFVLLIAQPRPVLRALGGGRLIGATVVAARAGELISEVALAVRTRMFVGRLAQTVHPYPTWSIAVRQAAAQFFMEVDGRRASTAPEGTASHAPPAPTSPASSERH
jgi:pyruvate/2-oxoglutarate dehydrogenase complex dihydrolipoamide dehydrogenase (E3) component